VPERLDHVSVATRYGSVAIPWDARDALLDEFRNVIREFQAVGASRPVNLDSAGKRLVVEAIHAMAEKAEDGFDGLDSQLVQLRHKLVDELNPPES
jgi:hypothetical protein